MFTKPSITAVLVVTAIATTAPCASAESAIVKVKSVSVFVPGAGSINKMVASARSTSGAAATSGVKVTQRQQPSIGQTCLLSNRPSTSTSPVTCFRQPLNGQATCRYGLLGMCRHQGNGSLLGNRRPTPWLLRCESLCEW